MKEAEWVIKFMTWDSDVVQYPNCFILKWTLDGDAALFVPSAIKYMESAESKSVLPTLETND